MNECAHEWVMGPYYIVAAMTFEEPRYYPPNAMVNIMHCTKCGLLKLGTEGRNHKGSYYNAPQTPQDGQRPGEPAER